MKTYNNLWPYLCSFENIEYAFEKARKHKTLKKYVIDFEENLEENLLELQTELLLYSYKPRPLKTFILRDPKIRKISKSHFRDRIVHHVLINIIGPIFERLFIYDSFANRKTKGTLKAIERFDLFKRKIVRGGGEQTIKGCILKADLKHYFDEVDHEILLKLIKRRIKDEKIIWLIKRILNNHKSENKTDYIKNQNGNGKTFWILKSKKEEILRIERENILKLIELKNLAKIGRELNLSGKMVSKRFKTYEKEGLIEKYEDWWRLTQMGQKILGIDESGREIF